MFPHDALPPAGAARRRAGPGVKYRRGTMTDRNARFAATLVHALERLGVRHACVTPGSRNTPLSQALAASPIHDWSHHDERSSAFFALGIAKSTGTPVILVTTSGTAAAELHPALAEAMEGRVPLIAITADRPPEVRGLGAPQTIDQHGLFGPSVEWTVDLEVPDRAEAAGDLAARAWSEAMTAPRGPVHVNLSMREPLVSFEPVLPAPVADPVPVAAVAGPDPDLCAAVAHSLSGRAGIVIAGPDDGIGVPAAAARFAAAAGWPILADPLSGLRAGAHDRSHVLAASDPLAWAGFLDRARPEAVIRFGAIPTSKPAWEWLAAARDATRVFIEPAGLRDPARSSTTVLRSDVAATLDVLAGAIAGADPAWLERWRGADAAAVAAMTAVVDAAPFPNEPAVARVAAGSLPPGADLWVASSMPVRDLDAAMVPTGNDVRVLANRGANGIDGFVSAALGSAATSTRPTVALAGDLSFLHDVGALATAVRLAVPLSLVVVDNDGGGIFHLLPQARLEEFERHWGTPHGLDLVAVARGFGVEARSIDAIDDLAGFVATAPAGPRVAVVRTDRAANAELHRAIRAAVAAAIEDA